MSGPAKASVEKRREPILPGLRTFRLERTSIPGIVRRTPRRTYVIRVKH